MTDPRVVAPVRPWPGDPGVENQPQPALTPEQLAQEIRFLSSVTQELARRVQVPKRVEKIQNVVQGNTTDAGLLLLTLWHARQGYQFELKRLTIEAAGYTPVSTYSSAGSFWLGVYITDNPSSPQQGELSDFTPANGATGYLPNFAEYSSYAPLARAGQSIVLKVTGGPASKLITVRVQGELEAVEL